MSKLRADSWAADLTEEQRWNVYYRARAARWNEVAAWAASEYSLESAPSRSAFYLFLSRMRAEESAHRLEQVKVAAIEAAAIAKGANLTDADAERAYRSMAAELALRTGSAKEAERFMRMADSLADRRLKAAELAIRRKAQETKDEQLRLARERFEAAERREGAANDALADARLTAEQKVAKLKEIFG